jgi:hypothetical protein
MPIQFPPVPLYPETVDNDYTLFLVHNTVETVITADNSAWAEEIVIKPVSPSKDEIWSDNGFATISGELLYYNSVERNANSRVVKLKECVRNLSGDKTHFNPSGVDIRSFVLAEHHNQIAQAIIQIEQWLGAIDCDDTDTLNCCIEELDVPDCEEDGGCVDVSFDTKIESEDECEGTVLSYQLSLQGNYDYFRLTFGDGTFTTVPDSGTKTYAPGMKIDPVVTVRNDLCEVMVTGVQRDEVDEPDTPILQEDITIPIVTPSIPDFTVPVIEIPTPDISIPPIVTPCIDLEPIDISVGPISIGDINIPSVISLIVPSIPNISLIVPLIPNISLIVPEIPNISLIVPDIPNPITIIGPDFPIPSSISLIVPEIPNISLVVPNIPNISLIVPDIPTLISIIGVTIPSIISVIDTIPSIISVIDTIPEVISVIDNLADISLIVPTIDPISVDWGEPPTLSCTVAIECPDNCSTPPGILMRGMEEDLGAIPLANLEVDYEFAGIPSKIIVEPPDIPAIEIDSSDMPKKIKLDAPDLPSTINVMGMMPMPSEINVNMPSKLPSLKVDASALPQSISINWGDVPSQINISAPDLPTTISIVHDIPSTISIEGLVDTISVEGFPDHIPVRLENPEDLVFRVEPIEVKITIDTDKLITQDEAGQHCFALVPCQSSSA